MFGLKAENEVKKEITISCTQFAYPLLNKWIETYETSKPDVKFKVVSNTSDAEECDIVILGKIPEDKAESSDDLKRVSLGRYALLPITNIDNPVIKKSHRRKFKRKEIRQLYFSNEEDYELSENIKLERIVYVAAGYKSSNIVFSNYFGCTPDDFIGKRVNGDEKYLIDAVKRDSLGITYGHLSNIYDSQTRNLVDGISILPLHLNKQFSDAFINMNALIDLLENFNCELIPVSDFGVVIKEDNPNSSDVKEFIKWAAGEGQQYNHEYGLLNIDKRLASTNIPY